MKILRPDIAAFMPQRISSALSLRSAAALVLEQLEAERFRSLAKLRTALRHFGSAFGDVPLAELDASFFVAWIRREYFRDPPLGS